MADKIREIQSRFSGNFQGNDTLAAVVAYVPLFGWIYPLLFRKENAFCQFHGKQAMFLNAGVLVVYFAVWILENFPVTSWLFAPNAWFNFLTVGVWRLCMLGYFGVCIMGAYKAFSEEKWEIPFLSEFLERIEKQIKDR